MLAIVTGDADYVLLEQNDAIERYAVGDAIRDNADYRLEKIDRGSVVITDGEEAIKLELYPEQTDED